MPVKTPKRRSRAALEALRTDAADCKACPLWENATQTVFGEGASEARMMLVGEQPGDVEDRAGHPFVGPAGRILDAALEAAEIPRVTVYVTNAVKHFKWVPRGKRRLHKTPAQREVAACLQWLEQEIATVTPRLVVCLGATATGALLGPSSRVGALRGRVIERGEAPAVLVTVHPSYILRRTGADRDDALEQFVADLRVAKRFVAGAGLARAGVADIDSYDTELAGLQALVPGAADGDVVALMCHAERTQVVAWLAEQGATPDGPDDIRRKVVAARGEHELEPRISALWQLEDDAERVAAAERLRAERPGDARLTYEHASALDAAGREQDAIPAYREALAAGLREPYRHRARIQLASSLRVTGQPEAAYELLTELGRDGWEVATSTAGGDWIFWTLKRRALD